VDRVSTKCRTPLTGHCDPRFAPVRQAFVANFAKHGEVGAALSVIIDGVVVVDLCGGHTDTTQTTAWCPDTLVNVYSVGKGILAVLTLILVERGLIDLDAPVATFWPEFAAGGKGTVTVRTLLAHQAGLPAIRKRLPDEAMFDWKVMTDASTRTAIWWAKSSAASRGCGRRGAANTGDRAAGCGLLFRPAARRTRSGGIDLRRRGRRRAEGTGRLGDGLSADG